MIYIYINIYVHICMNRCILGEINEKTYILAKSPKVHKGGGSTPQPIGGYVFALKVLLVGPFFFCQV